MLCCVCVSTTRLLFSFRLVLSSSGMATKKNANWTLADKTALLDFLIEHKSEGDSGGFKKPTWTAAAVEVNKSVTIGGRKTFDSCKSKFRSVRLFFFL